MLTEKNRLTYDHHKSAETKSFDGVKNINLAKDMDLMAILCKVQTGYCAYISMFVFVKWDVNTWDEYYLSYPYFHTIHFP